MPVAYVYTVKCWIWRFLVNRVFPPWYFYFSQSKIQNGHSLGCQQRELMATSFKTRGHTLSNTPLWEHALKECFRSTRLKTSQIQRGSEQWRPKYTVLSTTKLGFMLDQRSYLRKMSPNEEVWPAGKCVPCLWECDITACQTCLLWNYKNSLTTEYYLYRFPFQDWIPDPLMNCGFRVSIKK